MKNNWLKTCFNMIGDYIPSDTDEYNTGFAVSEKFLGIADHAAEIANHCEVSNPNKDEQECIAYLLLCIGAGYRATGSYSWAFRMETQGSELCRGAF
jgi:hypothetical protein